MQMPATVRKPVPVMVTRSPAVSYPDEHCWWKFQYQSMAAAGQHFKTSAPDKSAPMMTHTRPDSFACRRSSTT